MMLPTPQSTEQKFLSHTFHKKLPNRKLNRLSSYDYSQPGAYFITICVKNRERVFGEIKNGKMILNEMGEITKKCWMEIPLHFPHILLDEYIIMPDHIHGILMINDEFNIKNDINNNPNHDADSNDIPWQSKFSRSISSAIRGFKIGAIVRNKNFCSVHENGFANFQWHKSFYDRIIRNEDELNRIRQYIQNNPIKWISNQENQANSTEQKNLFRT